MKKNTKTTCRKSVSFFAVAAVTAALLGGQVYPAFGENWDVYEETEDSSLIPDNLTIEEPTALYNVDLPKSDYGFFSWVDDSFVPTKRVQSCEVEFHPYEDADWSELPDLREYSGWDEESGSLFTTITVVVSSLEGEDWYDEEHDYNEEYDYDGEDREYEESWDEETDDEYEYTEEGEDSKSDGNVEEGTEAGDDADSDTTEGGDNADIDDSEITDDDEDNAESDDDEITDDDAESNDDEIIDDDENNAESGDDTITEDGESADEDTAADNTPQVPTFPIITETPDSDSEAGANDGEAADDGETGEDNAGAADGTNGNDTTAGDDAATEGGDIDDAENEDTENIFDKDHSTVDEDDRSTAFFEDLTEEEMLIRAEENHSCDGIYVSGIKLPWYVQFRAKNGENSEFTNKEEATIFRSYEFELWDLKNNTEYEIPDGEYISVTVPVKEGYEYTIEHLLDNGAMETIVPSVEGSTMIFSTHSFSPFGIAGSKPLVGEDITEDGYSGKKSDTGSRCRWKYKYRKYK